MSARVLKRRLERSIKQRLSTHTKRLKIARDELAALDEKHKSMTTSTRLTANAVKDMARERDLAAARVKSMECMHAEHDILERVRAVTMYGAVASQIIFERAIEDNEVGGGDHGVLDSDACERCKTLLAFDTITNIVVCATCGMTRHVLFFSEDVTTDVLISKSTVSGTASAAKPSKRVVHTNNVQRLISGATPPPTSDKGGTTGERRLPSSCRKPPHPPSLSSAPDPQTTIVVPGAMEALDNGFRAFIVGLSTPPENDVMDLVRCYIDRLYLDTPDSKMVHAAPALCAQSDPHLASLELDVGDFAAITACLEGGHVTLSSSIVESMCAQQSLLCRVQHRHEAVVDPKGLKEMLADEPAIQAVARRRKKRKKHSLYKNERGIPPSVMCYMLLRNMGELDLAGSVLFQKTRNVIATFDARFVVLVQRTRAYIEDGTIELSEEERVHAGFLSTKAPIVRGL